MTKISTTPFPESSTNPISPGELPDPDDGSIDVDLNPEPKEEDKPTDQPPVDDDGYKEKYDNLSSQFDTFKSDMEKKFQGFSNQPPTPLEPEPAPEINFASLDLGDMYTEPEKVQENLQKYIKDLIPQIEERSIAAFKQTPEFLAVTTGYYQDKYERQIDDARKLYGDRFTFDKDADPYMELMRQGKSVDEAHILLDYKRQENDRVDTQRIKQVEDDKRKILGIPLGQPIRPNFNKDLVVKLTKDEQWAAGKGFPELSQADANKKYAESKKKLLAKGQN